MAAASFEDELELFSGKQDLNTIVRSDYKGHEKVGVERHKPKDQIEVTFLHVLLECHLTYFVYNFICFLSVTTLV